jgi:hypothetical protein
VCQVLERGSTQVEIGRSTLCNFRYSCVRRVNRDRRVGIGFLGRSGIPRSDFYLGRRHGDGLVLLPSENLPHDTDEIVFPSRSTGSGEANCRSEAWIYLGPRTKLPVDIFPLERQRCLRAIKETLLLELGLWRTGAFEVYIEFDFRGIFLRRLNA